MSRGVTRYTGSMALAIAAGLVIAAPASGIAVSGKQVPVSEVKSKMKGDLRGKFKITKFRVLHAGPVFKAKGRERFNGCIDSDRDRSCDGEVTGKLFFKFRYWARFGEGDQLELGTCAHRVTGGEGGFLGASGFLMMVDTPNRSPLGFKTHYEGEVNLGAAARAQGMPRPC
jgi:hypothetical protein